MILGQRSAMVGNGLPYDSKVEYLESTGTQYIDTGIYPNQANTSFNLDISFHGDFKPLSSLSPQQSSNVLDARDTTTNRYTFNFGGKQSQYKELFTWFRTNDVNIQNFNHVVIDRLSRQHITYDAGSFTAGDTAWTTPHGSTDIQSHLHLLALYSNTTGGYKSFGCYNTRIYGLKVCKSGTSIRDFIPVRVGSGSYAVGYLYDRANPTGGPLGNGLYPNSGTGSFVLGPDVLPSLASGGGET